LKECIILAGGLGTRLNHLIPGLPKSLAPVAGKPFLKFLLDYLQLQRTDHFIFSLGYLHHQIIEFLNTEAGHLHKTYIIEEKPLGTGGAIMNAMSALKSDQFFVVNADTFYPVDLHHILNFHIQNNADITLALKPMLQPYRYGTVAITANGRIQNFEEKKSCEFGLINGGVYCINRRFLKNIKVETYFSFEKVVLEAMFENARFFGYLQDQFFIDIGVPEDYHYANNNFGQTELFLRHRALFLDRDGVINRLIPGDYVRKWDDFVFQEGCLEILPRIAPYFDFLFIITNQQCIGKGLISIDQLSGIHQNMLKQLEAAGIKIEKIFYCPHLVSENCNCRKPKPGMLDEIRRQYPSVDFISSLMIGDSVADITMAASRYVPSILLNSAEPDLPLPFRKAKSWGQIEQLIISDH